jgi:hypothetical protein
MNRYKVILVLISMLSILSIQLSAQEVQRKQPVMRKQAH